MSKGKVKEYYPERGCGVIIDIDTGQELTVYGNYIILKEGDVLTKDQDVEFDIENTRNGHWAVNVKII